MESEERDPGLAPVRTPLRDGCWPGRLAHAEGSGPKDTPEKPQPGGHRLTLELPVGEALRRQNLPESFLSGNLEPAPL